MKKITAAMLLTAALSAGVTAFAQTGTNPTGQVDPATAQTQNQKPAELKDVPAGHWASAAIQVAANCGIVRGFPDGTYRGNEAVTRYQAAAIIARLLDAVRNGECGIPRYATKAELDAAIAALPKPVTPGGQVIDTSKFLTAADLVVLQNAIQELAADLAQLGVRVAELEDNAVTADDLARVEEIATQARDLAEAAAAAAQEANDGAANAAAAAAGAQQTADAAGGAADAAAAAAVAAQQTADDALAAAQAAADAAMAALDAAKAAQASSDANATALAARASAAQSAADAAAAAAAMAAKNGDANAAALAQQAKDAQAAADAAAKAAADAQAAANANIAVVAARATAAQDAAEAAQAAADAAQQTGDDALAAAAAAQQTADDALASAAAAQQTADDATAGVEVAQQTADDAINAAANAQQAADDAMAVAMAAQEAADAAAAAAETAQQTADDAMAAAAAAQQAADDAAAGVEVAQQSADDALAAAATAQETADTALAAAEDAMVAAAAAQQSADDAAAGVEVAQQSADDALDAAANAQQTADDAMAAAMAAQDAALAAADDAAAAAAAAEVAQQTADDALALAQEAQPAGDYATNDDLAGVAETANQARDLAEAVAAAHENMPEGVDPEAFAALADQVEATSIAADTALAQARELQDRYDELNGRIDDLEAQFGELGATVEGQADSIAALNDLVVLLNQDVLSLQDKVTQLERGLSVTNAALDDLAATAASQEDLESLREFTTLIRRDQTNLADRVGELEARVGRVESRVTAVEGRVAVLEANAFTVSGTIGLSYRRALVWREDGSGLGLDFDIDRLALPNGGFGFGFSSGTGDGSISTNARAFSDFAGSDGGTNGTRSAGITGQSGQVVDTEGRIAPSATLVFTFKPRALVGGKTNGLGNNFSVGLVLTMVPAGTTTTQANGAQTTNGGPFTNLSGGRGTSLSFLGFSLSSLALTYNVGAAPLFINFGVNVPYAFTKFAMNTGGNGDGFVASLSGAGLLPLDPNLSIVYQSTLGADGDSFYTVGAKGTLSLIQGLTGGAYISLAGEDIVGTGARKDSVTRFGVDFAGKLFGFVDLAGEWNTSSLTQTAPALTTNRVASFVTVGLAFDPFTIAGNWRFVDDAWGSATTEGSNNFTDGSTNDGPYANNQTGFGITIGAKNLLGFLNLNGYFDSRSRITGSALGNGPARPAGINFQGGLLTTSMDTNGGATISGSTDFGVVVGLALAGFDLQTYFFSDAENAAGVATYGRSDLGVSIANAGKLIPGVNVVAGFNSSTNTVVAGTRTSIYAYVDTSFNLAGFTIAPKAYFGNQNGTGSLVADNTTLGANLTVNGDFLLGSKVALGVAIDSRSGSANASTWLFSAGLSWANGPLPGSTFGVSFSTRTDLGRSGTGFGPSFAAPVPFSAWGSDAAASVVLTGIDFNFNYYGLAFRYGLFNHTNITGAPVVTWGSRFTIAYSLTF